MIRDITLGQYYPCDSVVHRLDARTKIIATMLYIVELFVVNNFFGFLIAAVALFAVIGLSRVPLKFIFRGLSAVFLIIAFTFVVNLFMTDGRILWQWHFLKITYEGLMRALFMAVRLVLLIIGSSIMTLTTKPVELTDGLEKLLSPFSRIGLPSHELALMMTIALRFIPTLMEEVRLHEPLLALDGTEDGLFFYQKITEQSKKYLQSGGKLFYEIGYDQGEAVKNIMETAGFLDVKVIKDFAGLDRVVYGRL
jgi:hypothetical protein